MWATVFPHALDYHHEWSPASPGPTSVYIAGVIANLHGRHALLVLEMRVVSGLRRHVVTSPDATLGHLVSVPRFDPTKTYLWLSQPGFVLGATPHRIPIVVSSAPPAGNQTLRSSTQRLNWIWGIPVRISLIVSKLESFVCQNGH